MNQVISAVPVRGGWCVQILLSNGRLRWISCAGSFRESIDQAALWEPEEGENE